MKRLVICVRNDRYEASLEKRKIYEAIDDDDAAQHGQIRVIDESGEDYLYPRSCFVDAELSADVEQAVIEAV